MNSEEKKQKYFNEAKKCIEANALYFFQDVIDFLPIVSSTFYEYFPVGSEEHTEMERMLQRNRIETKVGLRKQMYQVGNPTAMVALYKLIATPEEREALSNKSIESKRVENKLNNTQINITVYQGIVTEMLKAVNRYSPAMQPEVEALASAIATLNSANKVINDLDSPFIQETSSQGTKMVIHPAYMLQKSALESMSKHSKLLGLDYENMPEVATEGPLVSLTKEMISYTKAQQGHLSVEKTRKTKKNENKQTGKRRKKKGDS